PRDDPFLPVRFFRGSSRNHRVADCDNAQRTGLNAIVPKDLYCRLTDGEGASQMRLRPAKTFLEKAAYTFVFIALVQHYAHATDDHPGDYIPLPAGTSALVSYSYYGIDNGGNFNGRNFSGSDTGLQFAEEVVRYVHYAKVLDFTV